MCKRILVPFLIFLPFGVRGQGTELVNRNFTIAPNTSVRLFYRLPEDEKLYVSVQNASGKPLKYVSLSELKRNPRFFEAGLSAVVRNVRILNTGVYALEVRNGSSTPENVHILLRRTGDKPGLATFNTAVKMKTVQRRVEQKSIRTVTVQDTVWGTATGLETPTRSARLIHTSIERVHSRSAIGKSNTTRLTIPLPENTHRIAWRIAIKENLQATSAWMDDQYTARTKGFSHPVEAMAAGVMYISTPSASGDVIHYNFEGFRSGETALDGGRFEIPAGTRALNLTLTNPNISEALNVDVALAAEIENPLPPPAIRKIIRITPRTVQIPVLTTTTITEEVPED
jgi:hypothetical protein